MQTARIRILSVTLSIFLTAIVSSRSSGCDSHPGLPHEEWLKWVENLNAKTAAEKTAAQGGTTSAPAASTEAKAPAEARPAVKRSFAEATAPSAVKEEEAPAKRRPAPMFRSMNELSGP